MKSSKISFPLVHKKSSLPTFALFTSIVGALPMLMVMWVAICSKFTNVEGTNGTDIYNVYVSVRAIFAIVLVASLVLYELRRASVVLLPTAVLGFISSTMKLIISFSDYANKKALAEAMSMHPSYTQNFIDIAEAAVLTLTAAALLLYLLGIFKTSFPVIFVDVITIVMLLYSVISYSVTYEVSEYTVFCRCANIFVCASVLLFCLSSKTRAELEGKVKYVPRRMKK